MCKELNTLDASSIAVRYPTGTNGTLLLSREEPVNIELFMNTMQEIHRIINWGDNLIDYILEKYLKQKAE